MKILTLIFAAIVLAVSCEDKQGSIQDWPWQDPEVEEQEPEMPQQPIEDATLDKWSDVSDSYGTLPDHIRIYKSPESLEGSKAVAYIAVADMSSAQWDVWSIHPKSIPRLTGL